MAASGESDSHGIRLKGQTWLVQQRQWDGDKNKRVARTTTTEWTRRKTKEGNTILWKQLRRRTAVFSCFNLEIKSLNYQGSISLPVGQGMMACGEKSPCFKGLNILQLHSHSSKRRRRKNTKEEKSPSSTEESVCNSSWHARNSSAWSQWWCSNLTDWA